VPSAKIQSFGRELVEDPLTRAFLISLMVHFIGITGIELGRHLGWWERSLFTELVRSDVMTEVIKTAEKRAEMQKKLQEQRPPPEAELTFVEVDPSQSVPEPPKDAKYYSSQNSVASNLSKDAEKETPKIDGKQDKVAKVMDVLRPEPKALPPPAPEKPSKAEVMRPTPQPQPPVETPKPEPAPAVAEQKPAPAEKGETLLAKVLPREEARPQPQANNPPPQETKRPRPRSVAEAKAQKGIIEGLKMKQHGGARIGGIEGLDVKRSPFGDYDAMFIEAVQSRWFNILDERDFVGNQGGRVVVEFRLHQDGRITDLTVVEAGVSELLSWFCQRAILDPAPYKAFPTELRQMMRTDYREIRFTFYYNQ
jgi:hypothetical protein